MKADTVAPDSLCEVTNPHRVYFIRHGETAWSLSGQDTGRTDLPLTPRGESMARCLASTLSGISFSLVLTSPRRWTRSTCALAGVGGAAQAEPSLTERDDGDYEGLHTAEIREQHPGWGVWADGCPRGAIPADVCARADELITRLKALTGKAALSRIIALWDAAAKVSP